MSTLACIRAGAPWRLSRNPHEASVYLDIRTVPGQSAEGVKRQLRSVLRTFAQRTGIAEPSLTFSVTDPPLLIDESLPVVTALKEASNRSWEPPPRHFSGARGQTRSISLRMAYLACNSAREVGSTLMRRAAQCTKSATMCFSTTSWPPHAFMPQPPSASAARAHPHRYLEHFSSSAFRRCMMPRLIAAIVMMLLLPFAAARAEFPDRTVTLLVSFPPGGLTDIPARILAPEMQKRLGHPVIVENKAGASGVTGGSYVVRSNQTAIRFS